MRSYLKDYKLKLTTLAPVFIGSGRQITKLEYIFDGEFIYVVNMQKLMRLIADRKLDNSFRKFMSRPNLTLKKWADSNGLSDYDLYTLYKLKGIENVDNKRSPKGIKNVDEKRSLKEIAAFIKNAYNEPYVPGSSIKGMLRSVILWNNIHDDYNELGALRGKIKDTVKKFDGYKVKSNMSYPAAELEKRYFSKLLKDKDKEKDSSIMRGLIIGDSKPLSLDDIVLCEKIDVNINDEKKRLNIMRECIRPGVTIECDLTIDETIFPYSAERLMEMIQNYSKDYFKRCVEMFQEREYVDDSVFIGGGAGYFSKTVTYSLFEEKDAVAVVSEYLGKIYKEHNHFKDKEISPHMQKCTSYNGKIYEMGKCRVEIE